MEELKKLVSCQECNNFLDIPIRLPCFAVICNKHVNELKENDNSNKIKCKHCNDIHEIPEQGFKIDKRLEEIIITNKHLTDEEKQITEKVKLKIEQINEKIDNLKCSSQIANKIYDKKSEIRNVIDLEVEQLKQKIDAEVEKLKEKIDDKRDMLFKEMDEFEKKCNDVVDKIDVNKIETMTINETNNWQNVRNSMKVESKKKIDSNLDSLMGCIENRLVERKNLEDLLEKIKYISNQKNSILIFKFDTVLGDLKIPDLSIEDISESKY
jgi:hypothetical protein